MMFCLKPLHGYVAVSFCLLRLTVEEHLWFYARLKGMPSCEIKGEMERYVHLHTDNLLTVISDMGTTLGWCYLWSPTSELHCGTYNQRPWYVQPRLCDWAYKRSRATYRKEKGIVSRWSVSS